MISTLAPPPDALRRLRAVSLPGESGSLRVACPEGTEEAVIRDLAFLTGLSVEAVGTPEHELRDLLSTEASGETTSQTLRPAGLLTVPSGSAVQVVDAFLRGAAERAASDIHLEPSEAGLAVRFRLDGVLHAAADLPPHRRDEVIARVKVLAGLDIAEKRRPQDGRLRFTPSGRRPVDVRVSTIPTTSGEKVVLRLLDRDRVRLDLATLGHEPYVLGALREAIVRPHGMVLVTGPTGSGKTTTLYAALHEIDRQALNVTTVEDPVEFEIEGVAQVPVRPEIGFSFAEALRAFLRQDPDVVMVGEIRDRETAEVAVRAALTGHLVLSTLHTNDAASAVTRLVDMGVEPYLVAASLRFVLAQRLVRRTCPECRAPLAPEDLLPEERPFATPERPVWRGYGCTACAHTGYAGRIAVAEALPISDAIAALITDGAGPGAIRQAAAADGWRSLRENAERALYSGHTTASEVLRHTLA
ncbi:GspE/PulE family protein [Rubricoccus marinus]|uniref:Bacterial type II secretion system protein E domain-containing protein n=1 Tax=Rubricoccus marinus TaxID=716817 RepID=A0A259TUA7_9BACT|nr:GspE/PulE family protein [Rubricoccus marinus]OZC01276.1 hypothetical protein BSZ36_17670 [Rubricoccus marinus]